MMSGVLFGTLYGSHFLSQKLHIFCVMLDEIYHACKNFQLVSLHYQKCVNRLRPFNRLINSNILFCIADWWKSSLCTASLRLGVFGKACSIARWTLVVAFAKSEKLLNGLVRFLSVSCFSSISIVFKKSMFCNSFATFFSFPFH